MAYSSLEEDIFVAAKKRSLGDFLDLHFHTQAKKIGSVKYRMHHCPACGESPGSSKLVIRNDRTWSCWVCDKFGSIIDAALYFGVASTPLDAAQYITGNEFKSAIPPELAVKLQKEKTEVSLARSQIVSRLHDATRNSWSADVERYLTDTRCFPRKIVLEAHKRGLIGLIPSFREGGIDFLKHHLGVELMVKAKAYDPEKDRSWLASYPLIQFQPGLTFAEVRRIWIPAPKPGDDPVKKSLGLGSPAIDQHPYYWNAAATERCLLTEGLMDALAAVSQGYPNLIIATSGISKWNIQWFIDLHKRGVKVFDLGYDNAPKSLKNPGQAIQNKIAKELTMLNIPWANASPPDGDINDQLIKAVRSRTVLKT